MENISVFKNDLQTTAQHRWIHITGTINIQNIHNIPVARGKSNRENVLLTIIPENW